MEAWHSAKTSKSEKEKYMKKTIVGIICILIIGISAASDIIQVDEDGRVHVIKEDQLRVLTGPETQAYENPQEKVPIWRVEVKKVGFFHYVKVSESTSSLVFDGEKIEYVDTEKVVKQSEPNFLYYKLFVLMAIGLLVVSNVTYKKSDLAFAAFAVSAAIAFATIASGAIAASGTFAFAAIVIAHAASIIALASTLGKKMYITYSTILYTMYLIALFV